MTHCSRRDFLSATAAWGMGWPFARAVDAAWQGPSGTPATASFLTFDAPGFPVLDAGPLRPVPGARSIPSIAALRDGIPQGHVLVWRHGSTFPADAWPAISRFLESGGSILYVGGEPWTRPVRQQGDGYDVEPRTVAYLQALRLNQSYRVTAGVGGAVVRGAAGERPLPDDCWIAALEPRFTDTRDFPAESGSPGARDALLRPLLYAYRPAEDPRFPFAAVAYAVDRLRGPFAGGRWVFWLASTAPSDDEWALLLQEAAREPLDLRVDPTYGCYHDGERPSVIVRLHRPRASRRDLTPRTVSCAIRVDGPGAAAGMQHVELAAGEHASVRLVLQGRFAPGLHRVVADAGVLGRATTGFWMFDPVLFASGAPLARDRQDEYTLRRNGIPAPIVGTTTMSPTVHRDFLFEPNAAAWDDTFAELASLQVNAIRTGLWSGWRRITTDGNIVDESFLRALEAYYLTARRHDIPVIFSVWAFVPDDFATGDPYFDPRALAGQRAFLAALARRMAAAKTFVWDLINEPSFASPAHLWSLRPVRSAYERTAFLRWLEARYGGAADAAPGRAAWDATVRRRWRLREEEPIDLPRDEDFADVYVIGARRPFRALDYALFAQHEFERWAAEMRATLTAAGSAAAVTVGQDEAGLNLSPAPLHHHATLDFTSMHTWWNNDALLWDGVLAKGTGTPLLVSETGIMQRQRLSGEAVRTPDEFARLLARKMAYAFASGASGVIQWCYETNPFMDSDNEAAIGLKRVDGSVKPEHEVLARAAAFVSRNRQRFDGYVPPDVALIVPPEQHAPRSLAAAATRIAVRTFYEQLGVRVRAVSAYRAERDLGQPAAIVLPACRGIVQWDVVRAAVEKGATLICSGWFEADDVELQAERLRPLVPAFGDARPLNAIEPIAALDGGAHDVFRFPGTIPESWYAANTLPSRTRHGAGTIVHHPLPVEWAEPTPALARFYRAALAGTTVRPLVDVLPPAPRLAIDSRGPDYLDAVVVVTLPFRRDWLVVALNEGRSAARFGIRRPGGAERIDLDVWGGRGRLAFVDPERWTLIDVM